MSKLVDFQAGLNIVIEDELEKLSNETSKDK